MSDSRSPLDWRDGQPVSRLYGDVYFSRASGIDETRHVFMAHNRLTERWTKLAPTARFVIGETGFGTGLNFLCAWQLWRELAPAVARLHFVSIEKHPLDRDDLRRALELWPALARERDMLLAQYDDPAPGWHRFVLDGGRVVLTLAVGAAAAMLPQLDATIDAWFLDGFAPARNPDMWSHDVLQQVATRSRIGTTFATFTAAGDVRRSLESSGFRVDKVTGYGTKRDMLCGELVRSPEADPVRPWFARPPRPDGERAAIVVGGGLAGTSAAASLAARGWRVDLIERHAALAAAASGNPQGVLYAKLAAQPTALRELVLAGYAFTTRRLAQLDLDRHDYDRCGVLQLAFDADEAARQARLLQQDFPRSLFRAVDRMEAATLAGIDVPHGGLFFPAGGWVHPPALCAALAAHAGIHVHTNASALALLRNGDQWEAWNTERCLARAPVAIIAGAGDTVALAQTSHLPLRQIRGQITLLPQTPRSAALCTVICADGYVAPARGGLHSVGATHKFHDASNDVREAEHVENLAMLAALAPALRAEAPAPASLAGRAAQRTSTPDYLPIVGPVVDAAAFRRTYAALSRDATLAIDAPAPWLDGLYVSTAHGSRGLLTTPIAGETLAAYLEDEPAPLGRRVLEAVHPSRFLLRALVRRIER